MGRILQIRVSAWTYDEDEVLQAWPKLCALVWSRHQMGVIGLAENSRISITACSA